MLKAAKGKVIITPSPGTPMAGNIRLDNKSRGVHDDLYCNVLILKDNNIKICLLGFDLIGLEFATCNEIKSGIEKSTDIASGNIVIWATHTHSGPDTGMRMYQGTGEEVTAYLETMTLKVTSEVIRVNERYEEVSLKAGSTSVADLSFNRRLVKKDGSVVMNFEEFIPDEIIGTTGPVDKELITLSVWDKDNRLFALLINFALHPAILVGYKWLISKDYINYLDEYISDHYGTQVITLFANGAEGNINHLNYLDQNQHRSFSEAKRVGRRLGKNVNKCVHCSTVLDGKIRFVSEKVALPLREITQQEKEWADMVLERDKDLSEDMFDGIPDKTYARMINEMLVRSDKECETVLQGMAVNNFAFVTFPGEMYVEFGLRVKEYSPYTYTMIIGLANSQTGYIPAGEAFRQGGYEVRTAWSSQLVHDAGDILVKLVNGKILDSLYRQSVKIMERKASENKYLHKDFHIALNLFMIYLNDNFGKDAVTDYLKQYSRAYYKPLNQKLKSGDKEVLVSWFRDVYDKEEWPVRITSGENYVEISQDACPAISHIVRNGGKPCTDYRETYNTVYTTLCENTPFEYILEYFNDETGACRQKFMIKEI